MFKYKPGGSWHIGVNEFNVFVGSCGSVGSRARQQEIQVPTDKRGCWGEEEPETLLQASFSLSLLISVYVHK